MKLYLSSYRLGDKPEQLTELLGDNKKVAVIPNALDFSTDLARREQSQKREFDDLKSICLLYTSRCV